MGAFGGRFVRELCMGAFGRSFVWVLLVGACCGSRLRENCIEDYGERFRGELYMGALTPYNISSIKPKHLLIRHFSTLLCQLRNPSLSFLYRPSPASIRKACHFPES